MATPFSSQVQEKLFSTVRTELENLGYRGELLQSSYSFDDWFLPSNPARTAPLAAFGRAPLDPDNACFAVLLPNGKQGPDLISEYRSLGATHAFEVADDRVNLWPIRTEAEDQARVQPTTIAHAQLRKVFASHAREWAPAAMLRAKNIVPDLTQARQLDFIDVGLIPAFEEHVREKLDPLLRRTFFAALKTYKRRTDAQPEPGKLFRLVFRILAGKVMTDREMPKFRQFAHSPNPGALLDAVNEHFGDAPHLIADTETRQVVVDGLWGAFSLRHISAAVLSLIWENTLVDAKVRKTLGLYGTPTSVARYMADQVGLGDAPESERFVVEPCCGNGVFLLAAMKRLVSLLDPEAYDGPRRHSYLKKMLSGFDIDPFGLEVARDCLMLADFPNSNGWALSEENVFHPAEQSPGFHAALRRARFVLCNPPFTPKFTPQDRKRYGATSPFKPIELITKVLQAGPSLLGLGFVLPHQVLSGPMYRDVRSRLAKRFDSIELVSLPKSGVFAKAHYETAVLIAKGAKPATQTKVTLTHRKVSEQSWPLFNNARLMPSGDSAVLPIKAAENSFIVADLQEVWTYLAGYSTVGEVTRNQIYRGIQWNKRLSEHRAQLIRDHELEGYRRGIPSSPGNFFAYLCPQTKYLSVKPEDRLKTAFDRPWDQPKVIMNANRKGGGHPWRIAAFADRAGLICYHTFVGLWVADQRWSPELLAAVLNGPVACAFATGHATDRHVTEKVVRAIPMPRVDAALRARVDVLTRQYVSVTQTFRQPSRRPHPEAERILLEIDAAILRGYGLPSHLARKVLEYFNGYGAKRPVGFPVDDYFSTRSGHARISPFDYLSNAPRPSSERRFIPAEEDDTREQQETWDFLQRALDEDRLSSRKLFP